ncbi:MAG: DUF6732 family protein, partial [Rhodobiaceae bacterium]
NLLHNQVLHQQVVMLTVRIADHPHVPRSERFAVENFGTGFFRMTLHFGYMDAPNVPAALAHWGHLGELAGHGHLAGLALGAAAAVMAAALVVKGRDEAGQDEAGRDEGAGDPAPGADGEPEGETADA